MKLETFFEKFDQFADAPDAVAKMRDLVLNFAVTGKLSKHRSGDDPVSGLVNALSAAKARRGKNGRRGAAAAAPPESVVNRPIDAPAHWAWVPLNEIGAMSGGMTPSKDKSAFWDGDVNWFSSKDIKSDELTESELKITREATEATGLQVYAPGCLVIVARSGILKRTLPVAILRVEGTVNQDLKVLSPFVGGIERYLQIMLRGMTSFILAELVKTGMTVQSLKYEEFEAQPFPLPPLAEQKRIVAKVDELMALCDRLEAQQQERETRHAALARASLARFADAPTPGNLQLLFHPSYAIPPADLRKSILTLAVQGKLVPQDPNDEPAEDSPTSDLSLPSEAAETPFEVPSDWRWKKLGAIALVERGGSPRPIKDYITNDPNGLNWIKISDTKKGGKYITSTEEKIRPEGLVKTRKVYPGDFLLTNSMSFGRPYISKIEGCIHDGWLRIHPPEQVEPDYLYHLLSSPYVYSFFSKAAAGAVVQNLNVDKVRELAIPIPPLNEQRRIVAKVEQLMALVDELEMQLAASRTMAANILDAFIVALTGVDHHSVENQKKTVTVAKNNMKSDSENQAELRGQIRYQILTTKSFTLRRFAMISGYRSLGQFDCTFHTDPTGRDEATPICLVGLNGSGKSNLIEALAEVFCFLELINLPWSKLRSAQSRYRENRHLFELEYSLMDADGDKLVRVRKTRKNGADFYLVNEDGIELPVGPGAPQLHLLPRRVIGYSSGLNETVSHPFLRTKTIYSEEVRDAAPAEGSDLSEGGDVFDTRSLYMDYDSNAAVIICNYIFGESADLDVLKKFTRVSGVSSFGLRFNRKRAGKSGPSSIVRLTRELESYLKSFVQCAGSDWKPDKVAYSLDFKLTPEIRRRFRDEFGSAETLFMAMHKWSLLNALILSDSQRKVYLSPDVTVGALERPPSVPPSDRVFNIVGLKLNLSVPATEIDYSGLSDGEHQLMQVIGTVLLFSEPGALFLLDEPESHFNPEWRTKFNLTLNKLPNAKDQEFVVSTHSPFVVSGSRMGNVYKFERTGGEIKCAPVQFETYGASFDLLLKNLFSIDSLIDQSARQDLERIIKSGDMDQMQEAVGEFAESKEKRRLYEAIVQKEQQQ